ncbi:MAG: purine-nucleoside phosphorylase [Planctomycetota bacterium]|jgi:purine-nucleoside phosphorylase
MQRIKEAAAFIASKWEGSPDVGMVLGSGLSDVLSGIDGAVEIPGKEIPHFPVSGVPGHKGGLILVRLGGKTVAVLRGRVHAYEGYTLAEVVFPVRVLAVMGVRTLLLTNAAGAVDETFETGDLMLVEDHLNFIGANPLAGPNLNELGPRFPDMTDLYDPHLGELAAREAKNLGIRLRKGVYASMAGPSYETPAEIKMLRALGAHAVGMSTVPEAIAARHAGVRVLAVSMISNLAAGLSPKPLSHEEVLETGAAAAKTLGRLIAGLASQI